MENQHRKITGYRELTAAEIALMNEIKEHAERTLALARMVEAHLRGQLRAASENFDENLRIDAAQPGRWIAIAKTDLQTGFMALTRAVAQPTTF